MEKHIFAITKITLKTEVGGVWICKKQGWFSKEEVCEGCLLVESWIS